MPHHERSTWLAGQPFRTAQLTRPRQGLVNSIASIVRLQTFYVHRIGARPPRHGSLLKTPVSIAPDSLDFRRLIDRGQTIGWAEATAEPLLLTQLLDAQAERCPPFRVFFPLTFSDCLAAGHPNVSVTALGGASAGRRFFADGAHNVVPANISDVPGLIASGRVPIDILMLQVSGPDDAGRYNAGLGIEHLLAAIGRTRLVIAQVNPELPWTYGDTAVEPGVIDILLPAASPPIELPGRPADPRSGNDRAGPRGHPGDGDACARLQAWPRRPFRRDRRRNCRSDGGRHCREPAQGNRYR